jgi:hypothetical protein
MSYTAAPSPKGTNYARLYLTSRPPVRLATDASPMNAAQFPKGLKAIGNDRSGRRWSGRDADPMADALDALQDHLQNCIGDGDDLNTAQLLLQRLLETAGGEADEGDSGSTDPEKQRANPDNFQGQDRRGKRMAGDQRPQEGKLDKILAAKTR